MFHRSLEELEEGNGRPSLSGILTGWEANEDAEENGLSKVKREVKTGEMSVSTSSIYNKRKRKKGKVTNSTWGNLEKDM